MLKEGTKLKKGKPVDRGMKQEAGTANRALDFNFAWYGGGKGGGVSVFQPAYTRISFDYDEDIFNVLTKLAKAHSDLQVWASAFTDGILWYPIGDPQPLYLGIDGDGTISDAEILSQTASMGGPWTSIDDIDITKFVVQPMDPAWTKKIVVTISWMVAGYWIYPDPPVVRNNRLTKIDYEVGL
ncbi:MAG: hypothetical protein M0R80_18545 [Proteobacteria bacterium]|jgi:hypothetical protein|nr:hypothetical protein [Pseudomonadota bacterium]